MTAPRNIALDHLARRFLERPQPDLSRIVGEVLISEYRQRGLSWPETEAELDAFWRRLQVRVRQILIETVGPPQ